jgi:hypothetical protein
MEITSAYNAINMNITNTVLKNAVFFNVKHGESHWTLKG